ncbi:UDP-N-acetylglucosamine 2-epimerase, partial [Acinetobacter baumannii]
MLGDRFEILSAVQADFMSRIPIEHIHGGELTKGALDDSIRHAITKLSHIHFASAQTYKNRILQLGEMPEHVYNVGALALS